MESMTNKRVCVMSGGDEVRYRSYLNQAIYARIHGFTYHIGIGLGRAVLSPYYFKFNAIREILPHFDWVLYLDDDVYITYFNAQTVEELVDDAENDGTFLVLAEGPEEPDGTWTRVNSGVMLLANDERSFDFLDAAQRADLGAIKKSWSEGDEGLFTNGDQDAIWRTIRDEGLLSNGVKVVRHRLLNSRPHYYKDSLQDAFAVHFCGPGDKHLRIAEFARRFELSQELVPPGLLETYSVRHVHTMSRQERVSRRVGLHVTTFKKRLRRKVDFVVSERRWK